MHLIAKVVLFFSWLFDFSKFIVFLLICCLCFLVLVVNLSKTFFIYLSWSNAYSYHLTQLDWNQFQFVFTYSQKNAAIFWLSDIVQTKPLLFGPK